MSNSAESGHPKVYFDVNVAGPIGSLKVGKDFLQKWDHSVRALKVFPENTSAFELVPTEGLLIELLGMPPIPAMNWEASKAKSVEDYLAECFALANGFFANHPDLTKEKFLARRSEQVKHLNPDGLGIFDRLVDQPLKYSGTLKEVHNFLALEAVCGRSHPKVFRKNVHLQLAFAVLEFIRRGQNTSLFRVFTQIWQDMRMAKSIASTMDAASIARMDDSLGFKAKGDFVDGELIHFAVVGYHEAGATKSVRCFTCDDPVKIKDRIFQFKAVLKYLMDFISDQEKETGVKSDLSEVKLCPGVVYIVDKQSGEITESIDVASLESVGS